MKLLKKLVLPMLLIGLVVFAGCASTGGSTNKSSLSPFLSAAKTGDYETFKKMIKGGHDFKEKHSNGWTALHYASGYGHLDIVKKMVELGMDVDVRENDGFTPLMYACMYGDVKVVKFLVEKGANVNAKNKSGNTPLSGATVVGNYEVTKYIVSKGAKIGVSDNAGWTALDYAVSKRDTYKMGIEKNFYPQDKVESVKLKLAELNKIIAFLESK